MPPAEGIIDPTLKPTTADHEPIALLSDKGQQLLKNFASFTDEDREFLNNLVRDYPERGGKIGQQFTRYLAATPACREQMADADLSALKRKGLVARGVQKPETVYEHIHSLAKWIDSFDAPELDESPDIAYSEYERGNFKTRRDKLVAMAKVHDRTEGIVSDFSLSLCGEITKHKGRLEELAAKVLFEDERYALERALFEEHEAFETMDSKIFFDFDKTHAVLSAAIYDRNGHHGILEDHLSTDRQRMKTEVGKRIIALIDMPEDSKERTALINDFEATRMKHADRAAARQGKTLFQIQ